MRGGRVDGDEGIATSVGVLCLVFALIHFSSVFSPPAPHWWNFSREDSLCHYAGKESFVFLCRRVLPCAEGIWREKDFPPKSYSFFDSHWLITFRANFFVSLRGKHWRVLRGETLGGKLGFTAQ